MKVWSLGLPLVAALSLAACGGASFKRPPLKLPAAESFKAGTCRDASGPILAMGRFTYDHASDKSLSKEDRGKLKDSSDQLRALQPAATEPLGQQLTDVIAAAGWILLRVEPTYDPALMRDLETARSKFQQTCTG
jgi:hypothetical protein